MSRRVRALVVTGIALVSLGLAPMVGAGEDGEPFDFVDTSDFPVIHVVFTPPEGTGVLRESSVAVLQDGEPVEAILTPLRTDPVEIVLLIDTSGSMAGAPIEEAKAAAVGFVDAIPRGSSVAVLGFGDGVVLVADMGSSDAEVIEAIESLAATGETALHDAVLAAAQALELGALDRQFIVLLSDGGDTASAAALEDVTDVLSAIDVGFYAIELEGTENDSSALAAMAEAAGGQVVPAADSAALGDAYSEIALEVVSQYAITFEAVNSGRTQIEVVISAGASEFRFATELILPSLPGETVRPEIVSDTSPRVVSPAPVRIVEGPSGLQEEWALRLGVLFVSITLLVILVFALMPVGATAGRRRSGLLTGEMGRRIGRRRGGLLGRRDNTSEEEYFRPRPSKGVEAALEAAGIALSSTEYLSIVTLAALGAVGLSVLVDSVMLGLLSIVGVVVLPRALLNRAADKRRRAFADQLEGNLQLLASTLRAGYGLTNAVSTVADEAESPSREEFGRVVVEVRLGRELPDSLRALAVRMRSEDFAWVADAIAIQQDVGGNLAEVLDGVGGTIRDRNNIRRQVHALSAEGRMSAVVLILLPIALAFVISIINPGYLDTLFQTTAGRMMLLTGVILMSIGVVWIKRLIKIKF